MGILHALRRSQQAFEAYSQQSIPQIDANKKKNEKKILPILQDLHFWRDVFIATRILTPIHEIQFLSETDNYPLYRVLDNWILIKQSLMRSAQEPNTKECDLAYIVDTLWDNRYLTQITELHVVATLLVPEKHAVKLIEQTPEHAFDSIITRFFQQYAPPDQVTTCMRDF